MKNKFILFTVISSLFLNINTGSFVAKKKHNPTIISKILNGFYVLRSMILYPGKMPDIKTTLKASSQEEIKQLNDSNQVVLSYTSTPSKKGLNLKLARGYKTHWTGDKRDKFKEKIILYSNELLKAKSEVEQFIENDSSIITPEWFEKESLNNPLCFLGECSTNYCPLTRLNTNAREEFENQILETIKNNFNYFDKNKDILNYTSFACGTLFPDLIILTKLIDQGFKKININLLDTQFEEYIEILKQKGNNISLDIFDKEIRDRGFWLRHHTYYLTQFLEWFANESGITINIYGSAQSYIQECLNNSDIKSDIIVGIDYIQDFQHPLMDYRKLVFSALNKNGYAFNLTGNLISNQGTSEIYKKTSNPSQNDINFVINLQSKTNMDSIDNPYEELEKNFETVEEMNKKFFEIVRKENEYPKVSSN